MGVGLPLLDSCCFIQLPRGTFASLRARKWSLFHIYSSTFIYVSLFLIQIYPFAIFFFFYFIHASLFIIFKLCISAENISLNHKNYNFLEYDWFEKLKFFINSIAGEFVTGQFNQPITSKVVVLMNQSHSKL